MKKFTIILFLTIFFSAGSINAFAQEDSAAESMDFFVNYGIQGAGLKNHRAFTNEGEGSCVIDVKDYNHETDEFTVSFRFRLKGWFNDLWGTQKFVVTEMDTETSYGDFSLSSANSEGWKLSFAQFKTGESSVYKEGGYHATITEPDGTYYNCYDYALEKSDLILERP